MTTPVRRRVVVCLFVLGLTLPLETILLQALSTPDSRQAISQWVNALSAEDLEAASGQVQSYPFAYRKELMRAVSVERRAMVWRAHIERYLNTHPELDESARQLLASAAALAVPSTFGSPSADVVQQTRAIAEQLVVVIGKDAAQEVLYRLGPRDGTFASLEPVQMQMANYVRGLMVAMADEASDCNCSTDFGCDDGTVCSGSTPCAVDEDWPMCGWFWNDPCNGLCKVREVNPS